MTNTTSLDHPRWTKLSKKRRQALLDEYRYSEVGWEGWWDFVYEDFTEQMKLIGIEVQEIGFSGFCSQGDGAWFKGYVSDWYLVLRELGQLLKAHSYWPHSDWSFKSPVNHRGSMLFDVDMPADDNPYDEESESLQFAAFELRNPSQGAVDGIESMVRELFEGKAHELYKSLEAEHDWLTSDEHIVDGLLDNMTDEELADPDEEETNEENISA